MRLRHFDPEPPEDPVSVQFGRAPLPPSDTAPSGDLTVDTDWSGLPVATFSSLSGLPTGEWALRLDPATLPTELRIDVDGQARLRPDVVEDVFLVLRYEVR